MKRLCVGLVFLLCSVSLHAQKTRMGQELPFAKPGEDYPTMSMFTECMSGLIVLTGTASMMFLPM
jgi:hypothetical protein